MVRTAAAGIKVSSGKSGKKGGGGSAGSSTRSASSKGVSSSSSNRLPSIPHTETPSWQKPITNFFTNKNQMEKNEHNAKCQEKESDMNKDGNTLANEPIKTTDHNEENLANEMEKENLENDLDPEQNEPNPKKIKTDVQTNVEK